jgi:hypothetical protein
MFDNEYLGLQENQGKEMSRSQFKRLYCEYLQKRDHKEIREELPGEDTSIY